MFRLFSTSDAQLVRQTLAGKRDAFGTLVERYQPVAYAVAYARVHRHADAEDVAQESLLAAYQRLDTLRDPARFGAWLAAIARHCASRVRERRLRDATMAERHKGEEPTVMPDHERRELWELIRTEIDRLNEPDREVVLLHYFAGKSSQEIASVTDATSGAVRKRLQRARETLGSRLLERAAVPALPDRKKTQHIMGLIAAVPAAWEAAGQASAGAIPVLGGITMAKIASFIAVIAALIGGAYVLPQRENLTTELDDAVTVSTPVQTESQDAESTPLEPITLAANTTEADPPANEAAVRPRYHVELQGIVFGVDKEPMSNVPVNIRIFEQSKLMNGLKKSKEPLAERTVRTDEYGYVYPDFGMNVDSSDWPIAEWRVTVPGAYGYLRTGVSPIVNRNPFHLFMRPTVPFHGTVRDANGSPIASARVRPKHYEGTQTDSRFVYMPDDTEAVTGADGAFAFNQLYEGRWRFFVQADGHGAVMTDFIDTVTAADITVPPALTLSGTVIDVTTGDPVAGLEMALMQYGHPNSYRVRTDDEGHYAFTSLAKGTYQLWPADTERFAPNVVFNVEENRTNVTIEMARGAVLTGRVLDADTGDPITGVIASAGLVDVDESSHPRTRMYSEPTGADGVYRITGLPDGEYQIGFGNLAQMPPASANGRGVLPVGMVQSGQVYDGLDYIVERRYPVAGVVRDPAGQPAEGVNVIGYALDDLDQIDLSQRQGGFVGQLRYSGASTDAQGRFRLWLPGPTEKLVLAGLSGHWATHEYGPVPVKAGGVSDVELTAYPAGRILGSVTASVVSGYTSTAVAYEGSRSTSLSNVPENERWGRGLATPAMVDDRGRFFLVGLPPDDYTLSFLGASQTVTLEPGETLADVILRPEPQGQATIEGVAYVAGLPTPGVSVTFSNDDGVTPLAATSNDDGTYRVSGVSGGTMRFSAEWREVDHGLETSRHLHGEVEVPSQGVSAFDIELARGTSAIEGVVTEDGQPKRARLTVSENWDDTTVEITFATANENGFYRITGLPPGDHELTLNLGSGMPGDGPHSHQYFYTVSTADGQTTLHDVHFDMGSISVAFSGIGAGEQGRVMLVPEIIDAGEMTLAKALSLIDHALYDTEIETDGAVTIEDVPAGTHTVLFAVYDADAPTDEERFASTRYTYSLVEVVQGEETVASFALPQ
jgi:RNA polymerase sigma-70 factor (ECF subfamily)